MASQRTFDGRHARAVSDVRRRAGQFRMERVVYGADDPKAGACRSLYEIPGDRRLNHRLDVIGGVMSDECVALLRTFFSARR